jgi:glycosyltransferase involved in cell wall biosynthesis
MSKVGVMHLLDTLALGGAERAAVNLVNELPRDRYRPYLCTTRADGPLREAVASDVGFLALRRTNRFDSSAIRRLIDYIRTQNISILHAHGSSLFVAAVAAGFSPHPVVVWHAHYGRVALENRRALAHRLLARKIAGVIAVNHQLAEWCKKRLAVPADKVWYIPNMVCAPATVGPDVLDLAGSRGSRIVCVANLRAEKDHVTLVRAMQLVVRQYPGAHLFLIGAHSDPTYSASEQYFAAIKNEVSKYSLVQNISFMGQRRDIPSILRACDIGVLSSKTEGLPVSLLEYGMAGLPVVATRVGECEEVLDHGRAGVLVPAQSPVELAEGLMSLIRSQERRTELGENFLHRVKKLYSSASIMAQVCGVYDAVDARSPSGLVHAQRIQTGVRA